MKRIIKFLSAAVVTTALVGVSPQPAYSVDGPEDGIIAVVNDEVITFKDLQDYIRQTYVSLVAQGVAGEELDEIMGELETKGIQKLVEDKLIISHANKVGIEVREKLVDERVAEIMAKYGSEQVFLDALVKNGANVTDLRNKIKEQLKIKYIIDHEVKSKVFVNPAEVTAYYEANKADFQKAKRINLDSIYVRFIGDKEAGRKRAQEALELARSGKDFSEVAKQYSDSPSIGTIEEGQLVPEIEKVVFDLKKDQISDPLETEDGVYIFQLKGQIPAQTAELKEVKDRITNFLYRKKFAEKFEQWLAKLKDKAYVEIKE